MTTKKLLDTKQAAEYLGVTTGTLAVWRTNKTYLLPYLKVGGLIRYKQEEIDKWLDRRTKNKQENIEN